MKHEVVSTVTTVATIEVVTTTIATATVEGWISWTYHSVSLYFLRRLVIALFDSTFGVPSLSWSHPRDPALFNVVSLSLSPLVSAGFDLVSLFSTIPFVVVAFIHRRAFVRLGLAASVMLRCCRIGHVTEHLRLVSRISTWIQWVRGCSEYSSRLDQATHRHTYWR